ncbi:MAG: DeoR/GlpR family DNA-binding transcription regulator [Anaerolineae bacterium]|nr:DeoR/GlpR family DNA-binding transcription regulator [Anaerolineae bacterium]
MIPEERRVKIQQRLAQQVTVTIAELAEELGTSEMTIRRDLDELEARGICQRIHGGAISLRVQEYRGPTYPSYGQREQQQAREKTAIARAAAALVRPADVIAIDSGTTAAYLAQALRNIYPLTVITNSLRVLDQLHDVTSIALICPGGVLSLEDRHLASGDLSFVGPLTVAALRNFRPNKAFITASGLTVANGITNAALLQAEIKRTLIEIAEEAILITDHTKFGRASGFLVAEMKAFRTVITDVAAPPEDVAALRRLGITVVLVEPAGDVQPLRPSVINART